MVEHTVTDGTVSASSDTVAAQTKDYRDLLLISVDQGAKDENPIEGNEFVAYDDQIVLVVHIRYGIW